jgi:hypothetical protein
VSCANAASLAHAMPMDNRIARLFDAPIAPSLWIFVFFKRLCE